MISGEAIAEQVVLYPATDASNTIDIPLELIRVGTGKVKVEPDQLGGCGTTRFIVTCPSKHNPVPMKEHCNRLACPVCYEAACTAAGKRIAERTEEAAKARLHDRGEKVGDLKHIVLSLPLFDPENPDLGSSITEADLEADGGKKARKKAVSILRKYAKDGYFGGTLILHPWRRKHIDDGSECDDPNCQDREHYWHWGPHFHYLGYGFFQSGDIIYQKTGWIFKRIEEKDGAERNAYATARYQLTHAGIFLDRIGHVEERYGNETMVGKDAQKGLAYHYVGFMSNSKLGHEVTDHHQEECHCEECQEALREYHELPDGTADVAQTEAPVHLQWVTVKRWYVVDRRTYRQTTVELRPDLKRDEPPECREEYLG